MTATTPFAGWYDITFINREGNIYAEQWLLEPGMEVKDVHSIRLISKSEIIPNG